MICVKQLIIDGAGIASLEAVQCLASDAFDLLAYKINAFSRCPSDLGNATVGGCRSAHRGDWRAPDGVGVVENRAFPEIFGPVGRPTKVHHLEAECELHRESQQGCGETRISVKNEQIRRHGTVLSLHGRFGGSSFVTYYG